MDTSVVTESHYFFLHALTSSRSILAARYRVAWCGSTLYSFSKRLSLSRASPRGISEAHMNPEPMLWSRIETRDPKCLISFHLNVIDR